MRWAVVFLSVLALLGCRQEAEPPAKPGAGTGVTKVENTEDVVRQMAEYLQAQKSFRFDVRTTMRIEARGMKDEMESQHAVRFQRPNRLVMELMEVQQRSVGATVVSDGKQLYTYLPALQRYSVDDAPDSFDSPEQMAGVMMTMGQTAPFILGLLAEDVYTAMMEGVIGSEYLGVADVDGVPCHHGKFIQNDVDWEIWVDAGERPLIRKLVPDIAKALAASRAAGMMKDARMEMSVAFTNWDVGVKLTDADFAFTPPENAQKVDSLFQSLPGGPRPPHPLLGRQAPTFSLGMLDGGQMDLQQHLGKQVILLDFWATWCGPCQEAMPKLAAVAERFKDRGVVFYAVNLQEEAEQARKFLKDQNLEIPVAMDADGNVGNLFAVSAIPQTVLIGKDGKVQVVHTGLSPDLEQKLAQELEDLLAGKDLAAEALKEPGE
jgi:peroxiredoxin